MPNNPASASIFLVTPCITIPARAKAAPVKQAANALGIRISSMILPISEGALVWNKVSTSRFRLPPATPILAENNIDNSSITAIKIRKNMYPIFVCTHCKDKIIKLADGFCTLSFRLFNIAMIDDSICQFFHIQQFAVGTVCHVILQSIFAQVDISIFYSF